MSATLVAVRVRDHKAQLAYKKVKVDGTLHSRFDYQTVSVEELKEALNALVKAG